MFVTEEEKQPLGGFLKFALPMIVMGGLAGLLLTYGLTTGPKSADSFALLVTSKGLAFMVGTTLAFALLLYRPSVWFHSVLMSLVLGGGLFLVSTSGGEEREGVWSYAQFPFTLLPAYAGLVLAGAWLDQFARSGRLAFPAYKYAFIMALNVPIWLLTLSLFLFLSGLLGAAFIPSGGYMRWNTVSLLLLGGGIGAAVGALLALVRAQRVLRGTVRFGVLWLARYLFPALVVVGGSLLISRLRGAGLSETGGPMALAIMLGFYLVYQDGRLAKPALWLRLSVWLGALVSACLIWPDLTQLLLSGGGEIEWRQGGQTMLTAGLVLVALAGVLSELNWRTRRWMPAVAPLSIGFLWFLAVVPLLVWGGAMFLF